MKYYLCGFTWANDCSMLFGIADRDKGIKMLAEFILQGCRGTFDVIFGAIDLIEKRQVLSKLPLHFQVPYDRAFHRSLVLPSYKIHAKI